MLNCCLAGVLILGRISLLGSVDDRATRLRATLARPHADLKFEIEGRGATEFYAGYSYDGIRVGGSEDPKEARQRLEQSIQRNSSDAWLHIELADLMSVESERDARKKLLERAAALFRDQVRKAPADHQPRIGLGRALRPQTRSDDAKSALKEALSLAKDRSPVLHEMAAVEVSEFFHSLIGTSNAATWMQTLQMVMSAAQVVIQREKAQNAKRALAHLDEAIATYDRLLSNSPKDMGARIGKTAIVFLREAARQLLASTNPETAMGEVMEGAKKIIKDRAFRNDFRLLLEQQAVSTDTLVMLGMIELIDFVIDADVNEIESVEQIRILLGPERLQRLATLGTRLVELSRIQPAQEKAASLEYAALIECLNGNEAAAVALVKSVYRSDPRRILALFAIEACFYQKDDRQKDYARLIEELLAVRDSRVLQARLASAYAEAREPDARIRQLYERLIQANPDWPMGHLGYAVYLLQSGAPVAQVLPLLDRAEKGLSDESYTHNRALAMATRGVALALEGKDKEAKEMLELARKLDGECETALEALAVLGSS